MDFMNNNFGNGSFGNGSFGNLAGEASGASSQSTSSQSQDSFSTSFGGGSFGGFPSSTMSASDFFMSPKEAKEKKKEEDKKAKEETKKAEAAKKKTSKAVNDAEVNLPVTVVGRNIYESFPGEGKKKLSEIRKELVEKEYKQFLIPQMGLSYHEASSTVYVVDSSVFKENDEETHVDIDEGVTVCDGLLQAVFNSGDIDKEDEEVSVADIIEQWTAINPSYKGCGMHYDIVNRVCYPVIKECMEKDFEKELKHISSYLRASSASDMEEEKTYKDFVSQVEPMLTDYGTDKVKVALQYNGGGTLFVSYNASSCYKAGGAAVATETKKKVEKKYKLPLSLFVVTWGANYNLTPDMFEGKEKVTIDEIKKVMASKERMFADSSRKMDTYYDEANNKISVMFISGTKGCELIRSAEELAHAKTLPYYDGHYCEGKESFRMRVMPHGIFYTFTERCLPFKVGFERRAPLIPKAILDGVKSFFRKDLSKEACCRIYYDTTTGEYSIQEAKGSYTKAFADYLYEADEDVMKGKKIHVMDIHSHNTMPAYFSSIDNRDDIYPGVFAVFGNLDKEEPSVKIRVGADGLFEEMEVSDFFELKV